MNNVLDYLKHNKPTIAIAILVILTLTGFIQISFSFGPGIFVSLSIGQ